MSMKWATSLFSTSSMIFLQVAKKSGPLIRRIGSSFVITSCTWAHAGYSRPRPEAISAT